MILVYQMLNVRESTTIHVGPMSKKHVSGMSHDIV